MEMLRMRRLGASLMLALSMTLAAFSQAARAEAPTVVLTEDWPPFNYVEEGTLKGFSYEIVRFIMRELKVDYPITAMSGVRGRRILDAGPRVFFFTMLRIPEREAQYKWIGPLGDETIYFYKKRGSPIRVETLDDARKASSVSCRNIGSVYTYLTNAGFRNLDTSANPAGIYLKVVNGRCDLAVGETPLGVSYWLGHSKVPIDALERTPVGILESRLYIACSKDIPDSEIALWQRAFDRMKASGEYDALYRKYYGRGP
jgi:polar amino acid transport system substrate-binding protein